MESTASGTKPPIEHGSYLYQTYGPVIDAILAQTPNFDVQAFDQEWQDAFVEYDRTRHTPYLELQQTGRIDGETDRKGRKKLRPLTNEEINALYDDERVKTAASQLIDILHMALLKTQDDPRILYLAWENITLHTIYGEHGAEGRCFEQVLIPALRSKGHAVPDLHAIVHLRDTPSQQPSVADIQTGIDETSEQVARAVPEE